MPVAAQKSGSRRPVRRGGRLIRAQTDSGEVVAAVLHVRRAGQEMSRAFGAARVDLPFLIASLTKPMTASGVLWLRDRRELALSDAVSNICRSSAAANAARSRSVICSRTRRDCPTCSRTTPSFASSTPPCRSSWLEPVGRRCCSDPGRKSATRAWASCWLRRSPRRSAASRCRVSWRGRSSTHCGCGRRRWAWAVARSRIPPSARCRKPNAVIGTGTARTGGTSEPHGRRSCHCARSRAFLEAFASPDGAVLPEADTP